MPQDVFLFSGTIRRTSLVIRCATEQAVGSMLAGAHEFIRIAARLRNEDWRARQSLQADKSSDRHRPPSLCSLILIFDEATSALDTESERAIQQNLEQILKDRTTLIIAHRLSTVRNADLIIVMDRGAIVETGNHYSLMEQKGIYYYLNSQQLES